MACRSETRGLEALEEVKQELPEVKKANISVIGGFDMTDPDKIENAVNSLSTKKTFDIVFLAAGLAVFTDDYQAVEWNDKKIEKNIFQNMLGSHITLSCLNNMELLTKGVIVVLAGGEGARGIKGMIESPQFASIKEFRDYVFLNKTPKYNPMNAIGVSKLCGALWTSKISKLEADSMNIVWFSPGLTSGSAGLKTLPLLQKWFMNTIMFGFFLDSWVELKPHLKEEGSLLTVWKGKSELMVI